MVSVGYGFYFRHDKYELTKYQGDKQRFWTEVKLKLL